jgi:hypothetical protein
MIGTFLDYILESRGKLGELAEIDLYNLLKKYHKLPSTQKKPAGFSAHDVDLSFLDKEDNTHLLEVKYTLPDFGQFELKWNKEKRWHFKDYGVDNSNPVKAERAKIVAELKEAGVETDLNLMWKNIPRLYSKSKMTFTDRKRDAIIFKDKYFKVNPSFIARYYKSKGVNYINIASKSNSYGLYHFGEDPAHTGCSFFDPKVVVLRARIKSRDSSKPTGYGFLGALRIANLSKSSVDLSNPQDIIDVLGGYTGVAQNNGIQSIQS